MTEWNDFRGVVPVISVILVVGIAVVLAAVTSVLALGLGEELSDTGPTASFEVDKQNSIVVLTHGSGDTVEATNLDVKGAAAWSTPSDQITAGERITVVPDSGVEEIAVTWVAQDTSTILTTVEIDSTNLLINPAFAAGSGTDADFWEQDETAGGAVRSSDRALVSDHSMRQVEITSSYSREFISDPVDVSGGEKYEFGGSYYLEGTNDDPDDYRRAVRIRWLDDEGNEIETGDDFDDFETFDEWTEIRIAGDAPGNAEQAQLIFESKYEADDRTDVYWDEIFLEKAED